jgi:hypothetical protein
MSLKALCSRKAVDAEGGVRNSLGQHVTDPPGSIDADQGNRCGSLLAQEIEEAAELLFAPANGCPDEAS